MDGTGIEQRKHERLSIAVGAALTLRDRPLPILAVTVNLSSSGVLLRFEGRIDLQVGEIVVCDFSSTGANASYALPAHWARGQVVRVEGSYVALRFLESNLDANTLTESVCVSRQGAK